MACFQESKTAAIQQRSEVAKLQVRDACSPGRGSGARPLPGDLMAGLGVVAERGLFGDSGFRDVTFWFVV